MRIGYGLLGSGVIAVLSGCSGTTIIGTMVGAGAGGEAGDTVGSSGSSGNGTTGGDPGNGGSGGKATGSYYPPPGGESAGGGSAGVGGTVLNPDPTGGTAGFAIDSLAPTDAQRQSDKLDVLFVVDNSPGMAGKQSLLAESVPAFVARLTNPRCIDAQGNPVATQPASGTAPCSVGHREFAPVTDMHLGVITSSLGGHGGDVCTNPTAADNLDDKAQLLPSVRSGLPSFSNSGFLSYDVVNQVGSTDPTQIAHDLSTAITAAGERGCGYEATLESMYRFLVDPSPPASVERVKDVSTRAGVNQTLLAQRAAFLRPDSSLAIVVLSDENDCSIVDSGAGWFVGSRGRMPHATAACAQDENDPCCRSCAQIESTPPSGCLPLAKDPVCGSSAATGATASWDALHDSLNLRCYDQKGRFGFDLLNPIERYSTGLTNPKIHDWEGQYVDNPLFAARAGKGPRSNSLVSVSLIVGAPWQDLASKESLSSDALSYLDSKALDANQRWPLLIGAGNVGTPTDPLMRESIDPRSGVSPLTTTPLVAANSTDPLANPGNGHEQNVPGLDELQYACTYPLPAPTVCMPGDSRCACAADKSGNDSAVLAQNSPICQPPTGGPAGTTQYFGAAYPGTRELRFARELGSRSVPSSICTKESSNQSSANFGYVPALNALVDRIAVTLK